MKCPICQIETEEKICPKCGITLEDDIEIPQEIETPKIKESTVGQVEEKCYAKYLRVFAIINLVFLIIGAVGMIISFEFNVMGISLGIASILTGITIFLLLETVADIYYKIQK